MNATNLDGLVISRNGHNITVVFNNEELAAFHEISDDYAHTNAADFKRLFSNGWFMPENEKLPWGERTQAAKNHAYRNL